MTESARDILQQNFNSTADLLQGFVDRDNSSGTLAEVFGDGFDVDLGNDLIESVVTDLTGETEDSSGVAIEILPAEQINNASGAYAADNSTIYLSEEFLIDNADNPDAVSNVVIDSVGHFLDSEANSTDSPGDEGEIFAAEVTGVSLSDVELSILRGVEDAGAVNINGENIEVEQQTSIIYVDRDAEGENNGTSWTNAYTDLQSALAAGGASDQIWVAEGTYFPVTGNTLPQGVSNPRDVSFVIPSGVEVYGGFSGDETSLDRRDWQTNETILSGNIGESTSGDNSHHVINISDTVSSTIVDGFTVTGGQADGENQFRVNRNDGAAFRGGINASPTLRNLIIKDNSAIGNGGGIYFGDNSSPTITSVTFINNSASDNGGAIHFDNDGNLNVNNSLFLENQSQSAGAIYIRSAIDSFNVFNSTFYNNQGNVSDAIFDDSGRGNNTNIVNNIFWNNDVVDRPQVLLEDIFIRGSLPEASNFSNNIIKGEIPSFEEDIEDGRDIVLENNITEDPLFVNQNGNNFRLQLNSPGINTGNNSFVSTTPGTTDITNNPRIYNETVDIGAYEYGLYASIDDVRVEEGNEGNINAEFTVTLLDTNDQPTANEITINYATANSTARNDSDYTNTSGTLVFAPGESTQTITVPVNGDNNPETNETFFVNLNEASGAAVITDNQGVGIIQNDDLLGDAATVYRFFNPEVGVHFYTASQDERDNVIDNLPQYEFEGASYIAAPETDDPLTGISPVYRFFNTSTGVHLYTINEVERDAIQENLPNYNFEGIAYYAYESEVEGTTAVYRFYNATIDAHFYTPSAVERDAVLDGLPDYELEGESGISFYVEPIPA
ncbi:hypothetical protein I4641_01675 [Waterburya agarophytonicola K14]|uniref:Calx-beta domain-containing protein n=1 Tax=Waterburya agarophytonicola KI4 TaxID=2874699 RepID=A0A964BMY2_9CYAN|nr:Calx-beta domain-containing protein [Waterburya agarophytonicola]MCC0175687.1 hypothetical protein [Waterburya agarophytonicola KI4]